MVCHGKIRKSMFFLEGHGDFPGFQNLLGWAGWIQPNPGGMLGLFLMFLAAQVWS